MYLTNFNFVYLLTTVGKSINWFIIIIIVNLCYSSIKVQVENEYNKIIIVYYIPITYVYRGYRCII